MLAMGLRSPDAGLRPSSMGPTRDSDPTRGPRTRPATSDPTRGLGPMCLVPGPWASGPTPAPSNLGPAARASNPGPENVYQPQARVPLSGRGPRFPPGHRCIAATTGDSVARPKYS